MKYYAYYPGCSVEGTGISQGLAIKAVSEPLGIQLIELEDWTCCGATPYASIDRTGSMVAAARNLALAEKTGLDLVTPCSACFLILSGWNVFLKQELEFMEQVNEALAVANLKYQGSVRVRSLVDVLVNDVTPDSIAKKVDGYRLNGLKVAPYYGCQLIRPGNGFDDPESPQSLDRLVVSCGAEAINFPLKTHCCGGSLIIPQESLALGLIRKLLYNAERNGAQCIVTSCPLCQTNLDAYQKRVNNEFGTRFDLPVLFITQLIGLALGIKAKSLGLDHNIVSPEPVLKHISKQRVKSGS